MIKISYFSKKQTSKLHEILISPSATAVLDYFLVLDIFLMESLLFVFFILVGESIVSFLLYEVSLNLVGESILSSRLIDYISTLSHSSSFTGVLLFFVNDEIEPAN